MRAFCALLLLALLAASAVGKPQRSPSKGGNLNSGGGGGGGGYIPTSNTYPKGPCFPGSQVKYLCNTCTCAGNGREYKCTRLQCPNLPGTGSSKCVPGTSFKSEDGCNDCFCNPNGPAYCTLRGCIGPFPRKPIKA